MVNGISLFERFKTYDYNMISVFEVIGFTPLERKRIFDNEIKLI